MSIYNYIKLVIVFVFLINVSPSYAEEESTPSFFDPTVHFNVGVRLAKGDNIEEGKSSSLYLGFSTSLFTTYTETMSIRFLSTGLNYQANTFFSVSVMPIIFEGKRSRFSFAPVYFPLSTHAKSGNGSLGVSFGWSIP